ncbi:MAG TPA: glycogen debranching N-terminal domain-containing protein [Acidimicrobiales bacterium]|nr:glycogen debranching N-terminal domain-containing protein [Acidimicrobiales bacterium]
MYQPWTWTGGSPSLGQAGAAVTLVEGSAFCISDRSGDMGAGQAQGLFFRDTRFVSHWELKINGGHPEALAADSTDPFSATFVLRAQPLPGRADSTLLVFRHRYVGLGMREDLVVFNYGEEPAYCSVELEFGADFANLFRVKEGRSGTEGDVAVESDKSQIVFQHRKGPVRRGARLTFSEPAGGRGNQAVWEVIVPPRGNWRTCLQLTTIIEGEEIDPRYRCGQPVERAMPQRRLDQWRRDVPAVQTDYDELRAVVVRSAEDLGALRIFDPDYPERTVVAAGAPWFMTLFGRDSLLTSWMALIVDPDLALGVLQTLARFQGKDVDPRNEEEPGRILHEMRFSDAPSLSLGGGNVYYGSIDATPLFVMLLGELRRWGLAREVVDSLLPAADAAMRWIEEFGDRDGDGYVEYRRSSDRGLVNQGWKDSGDSIRFADGQLARPPIALCEVQGYVYGAYLDRAHFADELGDPATAARYRAKASDLKVRFNRDFWLDDRGWYAMGLDEQKRPIDALASNMGHCLWTGIVDEDRAPAVAARLLSDDLFSGFGIRTLARSMTGYNPISYHNGSVWPHDNAIIAAGLIRYGFVEEAHRVILACLDAASGQGHRLPELYGGLSREEVRFPVAYPSSCSPQAWAAASPLQFLRSLLRLDPWVPHGKVWLAPALPDRIGYLRVDRIPLAGRRVTVEVSDGDVKVEGLPPEIEWIDAPRKPSTA